MKFLVLLASGGALALSLIASQPKPKPEIKVLVGGATEGYLSPCGCVKPMSGGIRRKATAVKRILDSNTIFVEIGPLVSDGFRQSEMKADALAESLKLMKVDAIGLTAKDGVLSAGSLEAVHRLSGRKLVASQLSAPFAVKSVSTKGWLIGSVSTSADFGKSWGAAIAPDQAIAELVKEAKKSNLRLLLLVDGTRSQATQLVQKYPIHTTVFLDSEAGTWAGPGGRRLMSPGEKGKLLVLASSAKKAQLFDLGPQYSDDPDVARVFSRYQSRMRNEQLLDRLPRTKGDAFAGSSTCTSCHSQAADVWKNSAHGQALATLEKVDQDRDPDCTGCHVVGLDKVVGFKSRAATPDLANVGCESCHGPAKKHVENPMENSMGKVGEKSCAPCHNVAHSPQFDFKTYWARIAH